MVQSNIMKFIAGLAICALPFSASAELVNINNASASAMSHHLKGIGVKKAKSIVNYRELHGAFKLVSDITNVKGIGEGLLKKNLEDMSLTGGVTKLLKSKKKLVVIDSKKAAQSKGKLQSGNKVALNIGKTTKNKAAKRQEVNVKPSNTIKVGDKEGT